MFDDVPILVKRFLNYIQNIQNRSKTTIKEYYYDLRMFFRYMKLYKQNYKIENLNEVIILDIDVEFIKKINFDDLNNYIGYLITEFSDKPATRSRKIATLKSFFKYLCFKEKVLDMNPATELESPKLDKRNPKYLTLDESLSLLHCIDGKSKERDFAIITIFLNCGLRLSELININIKDIRQDSTLTVVGKGNKERSVHLNKACLDAISCYIAIRPKDGVKEREALFLSSRKTRIGRRSVEMIIKKHLQTAGLDSTKYSPHKLRHTAATLMYQYASVDINTLQQILGHESIATTEIYTHINNSQTAEAIDNNPLNKQ